jgi:predicted ATPase
LRYRLLETTRTYALAKLNEAGETKRFAERHAEYFRGLFEGAASQVSVALPDWLGIYSAELDNVRAALDWAFSPEGDARVGIALTAVAVTLWVRRGTASFLPNSTWCLPWPALQKPTTCEPLKI